jgi:tRNA (cytidine56-2'-O)-methyltransferase
LLAVLRLGHRPLRDKRITTHVCLVARAFGAAKVLLTERDDALVRNVRSVNARFGGGLEVEVDARSHKAILAAWKQRGALVVHLTMYGEPFQGAVPRLRQAVAEGRDVLLVVGAEKVPGDLYDLSDLNLAVGNQPHSEVAALALVLHALDPAALEAPREGALRIRPQARGKVVEEAGQAGSAAGR